jgi:hypothetical protein
MSEESRPRTGAEARRKLLLRARDDESFRQQLLADPKGTLEKELGRRFRPEVKVHVIEHHPDQVTIVLPSRKGAQGRELSESDLETVAGGGIMGGPGSQTSTNCQTQ